MRQNRLRKKKKEKDWLFLWLQVNKNLGTKRIALDQETVAFFTKFAFLVKYVRIICKARGFELRVCNQHIYIYIYIDIYKLYLVILIIDIKIPRQTVKRFFVHCGN